MNLSLKNFIVSCFALTATALSAQPALFDSLYAEYDRAKSDSAKLMASFEIIRHLEEYQLDEQKHWLDTTATMAAKLPKSSLAYQRQIHLANWHRMTGNYQVGYELAIDGAQRLKEMGEHYFQCVALFEAGSSLAEFNPVAAIGVLKEAVGLCQTLGDEQLTVRCLGNLGYAMKLADQTETDDYHQTLLSSLEVAQRIGDRDMLLVNHFNLVEHFLTKGFFEQARQSVTAMRTALEGEEEALFFAYPLVAEGNILLAEGRPARALKNYEESWALLERYDIVDGRFELYPAIIRAYAEVGNYERAFQFSEEFQLMKDSILTVEKNRAIQNLQTQYETDKKEAQIAAQQADLARSRREKWLLASGLALLGGLSVLFWRQRQKTRTFNLQLSESNKQIAQKNQKLDLLMRELHHRVKNNMQLVSSLLRLQSRQVGDESAAAAIKAGQLRVEAMSLIHQRLYREEGISLVNMQEFAQDLVEKIAFAFGYHTDDIDLDIYFQPADLDVDQAMPVSLILNELLTNSFKYAFGQVVRPAILVSLSKQGEMLCLHYADNGPGLPDMPTSSSSFGTKLIASLSGQIGGQARQWNVDGAHFEVIFHENRD